MVFRNSKYITGENYLMIRNPRTHLILDPKYLDEDFIPEKILFRHKQMEELDYIRRSIMDENRNASDTILVSLNMPMTPNTTPNMATPSTRFPWFSIIEGKREITLEVKSRRGL